MCYYLKNKKLNCYTCIFIALISKRTEDRESRLHQQNMQQKIEEIYSQIQHEADTERNLKNNKNSFKRISNEEFQLMSSPEKLIAMTENSPDLLVSIYKFFLK